MLRQNEVISTKQFGFTAGRLCSIGLSTLVEFVKEKLWQKQQASACFIDLTKPFVTIDHKFCYKNPKVLAFEETF